MRFLAKVIPFGKRAKVPEHTGPVHTLLEGNHEIGVAFDPSSSPFVFDSQLLQLPERNPHMECSSHVSEDLAFKGHITQKGSLELHGRVEGIVRVEGEGAAILLSQSGRLEGQAFAPRIDIHGSTNAHIEAGQVAIHDSAVTRGSVVYEQIAIHGGDNEINLKRRPAAND